MAISSYPPKVPQKYVESLTSGSSWTVPAGVTQVVVTTIGGGGGGWNLLTDTYPSGGNGEMRVSTVSTTPGASIAYSIGAGGAGRITVGGIVAPQPGGNTTFTGATTANGGYAAGGPGGGVGLSASNGAGFSTGTPGATGGSGMIMVEYWL